MKLGLKIATAAAVVALSISEPASAKPKGPPPPPPPPPSCSVVTFNVSTLSCLGFYADPQTIAEGGPQLATALGFTGQLDPGAISLHDKVEFKSDSEAIKFDQLLSGHVVIGLHFGGGNTGFNGTGFWLLDVPDNTTQITWSSTVQKGLSAGGLYSNGIPGIPEPATWAMMVIGFGAIGCAARRRKGMPAVQLA